MMCDRIASSWYERPRVRVPVRTLLPNRLEQVVHTYLFILKKSYTKYIETIFYKQLEMRSVERGICPIATSIMNELFK